MISWKTTLATLIASFSAASLAWGGPLVIRDLTSSGELAYAGASPSSNSSNGDVIGAPAQFDIEQIAFTLDSTFIQAVISMNRQGPLANLSQPVQVGNLNPVFIGDLLFSQGNAWLFGIPLFGHHNLAPGSLYSIGGTLSAGTVYNEPRATYRPDAAVWLDPNTIDGSPAPGSVTSVWSGTGAKTYVTLIFTPGAAFWNRLEDGLDVHFAAATCGNDLLDGSIQGSPVPEPYTFLLLGTGLAVFGAVRRFRG